MKFSKSYYLNRRTFFPCACDKCGEFFKRRTEQKEFRYCYICSNVERGKRVRTHGESTANCRLYVTWQNMKRRCLNPVGKERRIYRGITVCNEWMGYLGFKRWALANGYADNLTIDRKDSSLSYCPSNCRWAGYSTQSANRKKTSKNKSGFIGVFFESGKYVAFLGWKGVKHHLGRYELALDAAVARDDYIVKNGLPHTLNLKSN